MSAPNPAERRMQVLLDDWNRFTAMSEARLLRWLISSQDLSLIEAFLDLQDENCAYKTSGAAGLLQLLASFQQHYAVIGAFTETVPGNRYMTITGPIVLHATAPDTYTPDTTLTLAVPGSSVEIAPTAITITSIGSTVRVGAAGVSLNEAKIFLNGQSHEP